MSNQLLSDEEILNLLPAPGALHKVSSVVDFARAVIADHTAKLLEGVALPEPDFALDGGERPCYYADTVAASLAAARAELSARDAEIAGLRTSLATHNAKVSGAGTASAGLPGWQANGETE